MHSHLFRAAIAAAIATSLLRAQTGNELIFVGSSTSGSTDLHAFVESGTGLLLGPLAEPMTDNVTDAVWANTGRNLYVGQSLGNRVSRGVWDGTSATWAPFYGAPGACYGLGLDPFRQVLWTLTGASGSSRELHCIDADPNSANYGQLIVSTTSLSGASRERWELSPAGNLAAVPHVFINGGQFQIVDTNPASATFLQVIVSTTVPGAQSMSFAFVSDCEVSFDEYYAYVLYTGITGASTTGGGLAVYDLLSAGWLDFDASSPGQQDLNIPLPVANRMDLSLDRSFLVMSGQGGPGWAARIDFDYVTPSNSTFTQYAGLTIPNANGISLSPENARAAIASTVQQVGPPGALVIIDVVTGAVLQNVQLGNMWNIYTTAWQDGSPVATFDTFGAGCAGTLGVPTWTAAAGSRPALGTTFTTVATGVPFGLAAVQLGVTGSPIGVDLSVIGMPGCFLYPSPIVTLVASGPGPSVNWSFAVPNQQSLFGVELFSQAFPLDPGANAFGFSATNGGRAVLGF